MSFAIVAILAVAFVVIVGLSIRRSRRRTAELDAELIETLSNKAAVSPGGAVLLVEPDKVGIVGGIPLPRRRLVETVRRGYSVDEVARSALDLLLEPWRPLDGPFSLKIHGTRVQSRLATRATLALLPPEPRLATYRLEALDLEVTYRVDGTPDQCITREHLQQQAIDTRDLHGIALAVARQRFDDGLLERVLESGSPTTVEPESATGVLLVLGDFLRPGQSVQAQWFPPDSLELAAPGTEWPIGNDDETPTLKLHIDSHGPRILQQVPRIG